MNAMRCCRCTLPVNFPGLTFNDIGLCSLCQNFDAEEYRSSKIKSREQLSEAINTAKNLSDAFNGSYDCIVALSGGKDSCYTLKYLVENYALRCLAITIDNGFLSQLSIENSKLICDHVGADFILWRPKKHFMNNLYVNSLDNNSQNKGSITRASDLCNGCINLINSIMMKEAITRNIPLIAGGYIAGQVPKGSCVMKIQLNTLKLFGVAKTVSERDPIYSAQSAEIERYQMGSAINILNPMLSLLYSESQIVHDLQEIGWRRPLDTGAHSSNCRINDLGIRAHAIRHGFHPYEQEISEQVRAGSLSRQDGIAKLESPLDEGRLKEVELLVRSNAK
jgi:tRNA(Ile)-lysidine synthase TilS/MesJ